MPLVARRSALGVLAALFTLVPEAAQAEPGDACVASYEEGQRLRKAGQLRRAMSELRLCTHACPTVLARDCRAWATELEGQLARLTIVVRAADGSAVDAPSLTVDGEPLALGAEGAAFVDPGSRSIRVEAAGLRSVTRVVSLEPGEALALDIVLEPPTAPEREVTPPVAPTPRDPPVLGYVVGGAGVALLGLGASLAIKGHVDVSDLRDECAPSCDEDDVDSVRGLWIGGGVAAGVGLIAVSIATWMFMKPELQTSGITWVPELRFSPELGAASVSGTF